MKKIEELRVVDLRSELDKRGLDKTGVKAVLIERLKKAIDSEGGNPEEFEFASSSQSKTNNDDLDSSVDLTNSNDEPVAETKEPLGSEEGTENIGNRRSLSRTRDSSQQGKKETQKQEEKREEKNEAEDDREEKPKENESLGEGEETATVAAVDAADVQQKSEETEDPSNDASQTEEEVDEQLQEELENEILEEENEDEGSVNECGKEGSGLSKDEYTRHLEEDSINLMLEDDDKMLDYEENDRIDMEELSNTDGKDKEDRMNDQKGNSSSDTPSKDGSSRRLSQDKSESDVAKSTQENEENDAKDEKKEKSQTGAISSRNLWVSGLASNTRAQDLKSLFSKHGKVLSAKIVTNAKTPGAKCYGFVTMATLEDANKCISHLNRTELHGRMIQVEKAKGEPGGPKPSASPKSGSGSQSSKDGVAAGSEKEAKQKQGTRKESKGKGGERGRSLSKGASSRGSTRERDRRASKEADLRGRLPAKDRVVDRRHEMKRGGFSNVRSKPRSPPRRDMLSFNRSVLVAGNSIAGAIGDKVDIARKYGIECDVQCWPDENLPMILEQLIRVVRPHHQVILIFGLTFEAWNYVPLLENQTEPRIVFPNPNFSLDSIVQNMDKFVALCKQINPSVRVVLVIPTVHDMFTYNESRVKKYAPKLLPMLKSSSTFNRQSMAQNCRLVYGKIFSLFGKDYAWLDKHTFPCQNVLNNISRGPFKKNNKAPAKLYLSGATDELSAPKALIDGLHPSDLFVDKFWAKYSRFCKPEAGEGSFLEPCLPQQQLQFQASFQQQQEQQQQQPPPALMLMGDCGPVIFPSMMNPELEFQHVNIPPLLMTSDLASSSAENDYIVQERERQRLRTRERLMREEERMRRDEEIHLRSLERRQKEEAERLHREREKLRMERERIEREKQELLRLEREQQRLEREKLERERDELRKQQMKYEEVRRGVKRPVPPSNDRDRRDYFDDRKRPVPERGPHSRSSDRMSDRGPPERGVHRVPDRGGMMRGSDRGGSGRGPERIPERVSVRGPDRGSDRSRYSDDGRDSRYERHGADRGPPMRGSSQFDDRRERDDRRPIERSAPRSEGRDHRGPPPPPSIRGDRPRDSHYNGGSVGSVSMDSWRPGGSSHASKNGGPGAYGSSSSGMMGGDSQGSWRPSGGSMTTSDRWGGNSNMGSRNSSMMDILRSADSFHMGGGQVPMNNVPIISNMPQGDRFGGMSNFRK